MNTLIKSFLASLMILMSASVFSGTVMVNGDPCGVLTGSLTVDASGNIVLTTDGNCGAPTFNLQVTASGNGSIDSDIGGMSVSGTTSTQAFLSSQTVLLTAVAAVGETFNHDWTGCDSNPAPDSCSVAMSSAQAVSGSFTNLSVPTQYQLNVATTGSGTVTGSGISCPGDCAGSYNDGTLVPLTATPSGGDVFGSWSGACSGTGACSVAMSQARSVTANFTTPAGGNYPILTWPAIPQRTVTLRGTEDITYQVTTTAATTLAGQLSTAFTSGTAGNREVTISTTPGDFDTASLGRCAASGSEVASISWTQNPTPPFPLNLLSCILSTNTTYYLNIRHTNCPANTACEFYLSN